MIGGNRNRRGTPGQRACLRTAPPLYVLAPRLAACIAAHEGESRMRPGVPQGAGIPLRLVLRPAPIGRTHAPATDGPDAFSAGPPSTCTGRWIGWDRPLGHAGLTHTF
jgi:hypothetical protein